MKQYKKTFPQAQNVHSHVLQVVAVDCDKAFQAFFCRVKKGETPGYPRFKGRHRFHSIGFKEYGNGFKIDVRRLKVSGVVGLPAFRLRCQTQPSYRKLSEWLAGMSGYPHGAPPARVRRFKTPTATAKPCCKQEQVANQRQDGLLPN